MVFGNAVANNAVDPVRTKFLRDITAISHLTRMIPLEGGLVFAFHV